MTIDNSLAEQAGMIKKINTYTYAGKVEKLGRGAKNADNARGKVTVTTTSLQKSSASEPRHGHLPRRI